MPHKTHLVIVIPVYNEGKVIRKVIDSLPKKLEGVGRISVLVVNDGSLDNTAYEVQKTQAILINLPFNLGYGGASIAGFEASRALGADLVVTCDGDGQHDSKDIKKLVAPILQNKADIVIGTRLKKSGHMPTIKKIGNWGLNFITFAVSRVWTTDSQSGFKAFSREAVSKIDIEGMGYEFCSEIIVEARRHKLKITEVPIKTIYTKYSKKKGQSLLNGINIVTKLLLSKLTRTK